jgi:hypothetical protein
VSTAAKAVHCAGNENRRVITFTVVRTPNGNDYGKLPASITNSATTQSGSGHSTEGQTSGRKGVGDLGVAMGVLTQLTGYQRISTSELERGALC